MSDEHAIGNLLSFFTAFAEAFQRREIARDRGFFLPGAPARHFASLAPSRMVRKGGFEPPRSCDRQPLKLVRLPVPPLPRRGLIESEKLAPEEPIEYMAEARPRQQ
jgi:hypothetical protein